MDPFAQKLTSFDERQIFMAEDGRVDLRGPDVYANADFDMQAAIAFGFSADAENSTEYSLPNGLFLNNIDDDYGPSQSMVYITMSGTADPNSTVAMSYINTLIWAQRMIKVATKPNPNAHDTWPSFGVRASEYALYYCIRRYGNAKYNNSQISFTSEKRKDVERDPESWESLN
ncbi:hypothetical protein FOC1_g10000311 [Fusarium oxysporum f. sp. cubense race 1]|uniref:Uncharacterized protein n=1 Tax=Fusarium oxysporum f. sp. cubense (strain race 1) TaxID=1229664 RepID=N4TN72_FUSC1|nr:hypothetical protein FOC1_g10000311 [Fusarium oxysporum f. sp. cubense race 1]